MFKLGHSISLGQDSVHPEPHSNKHKLQACSDDEEGHTSLYRLLTLRLLTLRNACCRVRCIEARACADLSKSKNE